MGRMTTSASMLAHVKRVACDADLHLGASMLVPSLVIGPRVHYNTEAEADLLERSASEIMVTISLADLVKMLREA